MEKDNSWSRPTNLFAIRLKDGLPATEDISNESAPDSSENNVKKAIFPFYFAMAGSDIADRYDGMLFVSTNYINASDRVIMHRRAR